MGKLPGSERGLPFGPYTITQVVGAGIAFVTLTNTTRVWGRFGFIGNLAIQVGVTFAVALALRWVKPGGRDPLTAALALAGVWTAPRYGCHQRHRRGNRPVVVSSRVAVLIPQDVQAARIEAPQHPTPSPAQPELTDPESHAPAPAPASHLERLLALRIR